MDGPCSEACWPMLSEDAVGVCKRNSKRRSMARWCMSRETHDLT